MNVLPEFVGTVHIILGPYRGNPIALYLQKENDTCLISPHIYPWNRIVGTGETTNKAAADFEEKWKQEGLAPEMYTGPHWEGGIKPEKPKPPPKPAAPKSENPAPASDSEVSSKGEEKPLKAQASPPPQSQQSGESADSV